MNETDSIAASSRRGTGADQADVSSIDGIVKAYYESTSFSPGNQPDYERLRSLFHLEARITIQRQERSDPLRIVDVGTFILRAREQVVISGMERMGLVETEIARRTHSFASITHLWSTYEARHTPKDPAPFRRGINSIQIVKDRSRWWILSVFGEGERPGTPIPRAYLV